MVDQFADVTILRYDVPGWETLSLKQKQLAYCLAQAALCGRDITWDQNCKYNLAIRRTLEAIVIHYEGDRTTTDFERFMDYTKSVWFSNGIHHHYTNEKLQPQFSQAYFEQLIAHSPKGTFQSHEEILQVIFDPTVLPQKVCHDQHRDLVASSAVNFYENVTQAEVEAYFAQHSGGGLNTKKIKVNSSVIEQPYSLQGLYQEPLKQVVYWLKMACAVAENAQQCSALKHLIHFYETGDLASFDAYNIAWVQDKQSIVDGISGFLEVYSDPLAITGTFEALVWINDPVETQIFAAIAEHAEWFEHNAPIATAHKRQKVSTPSYQVGVLVQEIGDAPAVPTGLSYPNSPSIQAQHGTKSILLGNIERAKARYLHDRGILDAFYLDEQRQHVSQYGPLCSRLHIALHEVVGHSLGTFSSQDQGETLKQHTHTIDEARADLVALYFIGHPHLVNMGLSPTTEIQKAAYTQYINEALLQQLAKLEPQQNLAESHMRARHLIAAWVFDKGQSASIITRHDITTHDGQKSYFIINQFDRLKDLFGELLGELQSIRSHGNYKAAQNLIERYGVKVDPALQAQAKQRFNALQIAPYVGLVHPQFEPVMDETGEIINVLLKPIGFTEQMLMYSERYGFLL